MRMTSYARWLQFLAAVTLLFVSSSAQEISINALQLNVMEGQLVKVCIDINNSSRIEIADTVRVITAITGGASTGEDFQQLDKTVQLFQGLEETLCFDIITIDDNAVEGTEAFSVSLIEPVGVSIRKSSEIITINDDGDQVEVDFLLTNFTGIEGESVSICIKIVNGSVELFGFVKVELIATDITTIDAEDYATLGGEISIPVGADVGDTYCKDIVLVADSKVEEEEELFSVSLMSPAGEVQYVLVPNKNATVTIRDGDRGRIQITSLNSVVEGDSGNTAFMITIQLITGSVALGRDVVYTVELSGDTATAGSDFGEVNPTEVTFNTGDNNGVTRMVSVPIIGDEVGESNETFSVSLIPQRPEGDVGTSISITIIDDESKCDPLNNPSDGSVTFTPYQGSMAIYTCDPTYKLIGASTRTCESNGEWSGNEPLCTRIVCPDPPPSLANGDFTLNSGNVVGSIATYTCDIGYRLSTTAFTRMCQMNEMWSMEDIMCEKVECEPLTDPDGGSVTTNTLDIGSIAKYTCHDTYKLNGDISRSCRPDGTWSGKAPTCSIITCSNLPKLTNGYSTTTNNNITGSIATYKCNNNYELITTEFTRKCLENGSWSMEDIECAKVISSDGLSGGAIAGIVIAILVVVLILAGLVVILGVLLWIRYKNHTGIFKPTFETEEHTPRNSKADIGEPVVPDDPEPGGLAESTLTQSNELLIVSESHVV